MSFDFLGSLLSPRGDDQHIDSNRPAHAAPHDSETTSVSAAKEAARMHSQLEDAHGKFGFSSRPMAQCSHRSLKHKARIEVLQQQLRILTHQQSSSPTLLSPEPVKPPSKWQLVRERMQEIIEAGRTAALEQVAAGDQSPEVDLAYTLRLQPSTKLLLRTLADLRSNTLDAQRFVAGNGVEALCAAVQSCVNRLHVSYEPAQMGTDSTRSRRRRRRFERGKAGQSARLYLATNAHIALAALRFIASSDQYAELVARACVRIGDDWPLRQPMLAGWERSRLTGRFNVPLLLAVTELCRRVVGAGDEGFDVAMAMLVDANDELADVSISDLSKKYTNARRPWLLHGKFYWLVAAVRDESSLRLKHAAMQLINAICCSSGDLVARMRLRHELAVVEFDERCVQRLLETCADWELQKGLELFRQERLMDHIDSVAGSDGDGAGDGTKFAALYGADATPEELLAQLKRVLLRDGLREQLADVLRHMLMLPATRRTWSALSVFVGNLAYGDADLFDRTIGQSLQYGEIDSRAFAVGGGGSGRTSSPLQVTPMKKAKDDATRALERLHTTPSKQLDFGLGTTQAGAKQPSRRVREASASDIQEDEDDVEDGAGAAGDIGALPALPELKLAPVQVGGRVATGGAPNAPPAPPLPPTNTAPRLRLKKMAWSTKYASAEGTVFGADDDADLEVDEDELVSMFGRGEQPTASAAAAAATQASSTTAAAAEPGNARPVLLDLRRNNNVSIALSQFKRGARAMGPSAVVQSVAKLKVHVFSTQQLLALAAIVPDDEECRRVGRYCKQMPEEEVEDDLNDAELFVWLASHVPRFSDKVETLLTQKRARELLKEVVLDAQCVEQTCAQLRASAPLRQVMHIVLRLGNVMNNTRASVFSIDTLQRLESTKANRGSLTLLHYVRLLYERAQSKVGGDVVPLGSECEQLHEACRVSLSDAAATVTQLHAALQAVRREIEAITNAITRRGLHAFLQEAHELFAQATEALGRARQAMCDCAAYFGEELKAGEVPEPCDFFVNFVGFFDQFERAGVDLLRQQAR